MRRVEAVSCGCPSRGHPCFASIVYVLHCSSTSVGLFAWNVLGLRLGTTRRAHALKGPCSTMRCDMLKWLDFGVRLPTCIGNTFFIVHFISAFNGRSNRFPGSR